MNAKKIFLTFCFLLIFTCIIKAQFSAGIVIGYSNNHLNTDISNRTFTQNTSSAGFNLGFLFKYNYTYMFSFESGMNLLQKNYSFIRTDNYKGVYETFTNTYLQLPITAKIKIFEERKFKVFFNNGIYGAYWLFAKVKGTTPNIFNTSANLGSDGQIIQYLSLSSYSEKYQFNNDKDNRFEFGLQTGIAIEYKINNKYSISFECKYYHSLTDQQKEYMIEQISKFNQTFSISVGFLLKFPKTEK